jgi:hypothetical protein
VGVVTLQDDAVTGFGVTFVLGLGTAQILERLIVTVGTDCVM